MKFTQAALSLLFLSNAVSAWVPRTSLPLTRHLAATQLFHSSTSASSAAGVSTEVVGTAKTESFRLAFSDGATNKAESPWHDIPLKNDNGTYNMVRELR